MYKKENNIKWYQLASVKLVGMYNLINAVGSLTEKWIIYCIHNTTGYLYVEKAKIAIAIYSNCPQKNVAIL